MTKFKKWFIVSFLTLVVLTVLVSSFYYLLRDRDVHPPGVECMKNLKFLHTNILLYLVDNERLPEKIESEEEWASFLFPEYLEEPRILRCHMDKYLYDVEETSLKSSYRINPAALGKTDSEILDMKTWLLREVEPFHNGKRVVCSTGGWVETVEDKAEGK